MTNLQSASLEELEALCDQDLVNLYRQSYPNAAQYREALLQFINRPAFPLEEMFSVIREAAQPAEAWQQMLDVCRRAVPAAPWSTLPFPHLKEDIAAAAKWLAKQLHHLPMTGGICLGLDSRHMEGGQGTNVSPGSSVGCDPLVDSTEWVYEELFYGQDYLIRGLYDLKTIYSQSEWFVNDEKIAGGDYFSFAEHMIFLGYSAIVLGYAFKQLPGERTRLVVWGFQEGELYLLGRQTAAGFNFLCKKPA